MLHSTLVTIDAKIISILMEYAKYWFFPDPVTNAELPTHSSSLVWFTVVTAWRMRGLVAAIRYRTNTRGARAAG